MAGRHRLRVDRRPTYRWILGASSLGILVANLWAIPPQEQPPEQPPIPITVALPTTTLPQLSSTLPVPTTSVTTPPPPPEPTTTQPTTTPPPPPPPETTPPPPEPTSEPKKKARVLDEPDQCPTELEGTKSHVAEAGHHIRLRFGLLESIIGGLAPRSRKSDHPLGLALDFSVNRITGDQIAEYAIENADLLSVKYVIWRQRIRYPDGDWKRMEDRGSATANHYDHVHISFLSKKTGNPTC